MDKASHNTNRLCWPAQNHDQGNIAQQQQQQQQHLHAVTVNASKVWQSTLLCCPANVVTAVRNKNGKKKEEQRQCMFATKQVDHTSCEVVRLCQCLLALAPPGFSILFTEKVTVEAYA